MDNFQLLKDEEVTIVKDACYEFGALFPLYFPERNIIRKIHEFVFSVPRFIKGLKTTGLLSEEEGERLHAAVNMELWQLVAVRSPGDKMQLVLKRQVLRSKASKNLIQRKPRTCKDCKASKGKRVFLRAGLDGQRHCPDCEMEFFLIVPFTVPMGICNTIVIFSSNRFLNFGVKWFEHLKVTNQ